VKANLLDWLLERIGLVIFVVVFLVQILRGLLQARRAAPPPSTSKPDALEEERRVQDIQAEIRRRIAERRGGAAPAAPAAAPEAPVAREAAPGAPPAPEAPAADPFEPMRRMMRDFEEQAREMERKISGEEPAAAAPPPPLAPVPAAARVRSEELERQRVLAEQLAALEAERAAVRRRAEEAAAPVPARGMAVRGSVRLVEELRDPGALRRAVLLREVLGTPVGLR